jgi:hypothetical protein
MKKIKEARTKNKIYICRKCGQKYPASGECKHDYILEVKDESPEGEKTYSFKLGDCANGVEHSEQIHQFTGATLKDAYIECLEYMISIHNTYCYPICDNPTELGVKA